MARTSASAVKAILGDNYDGSTSLTGPIAAANAIVTRLAALDSDSLLDSTTLELIERYVAAHYYTIQDPLATKAKIGKAEDEYGLRTTYWEAAKSLDFTGNLGGLGKARPKMEWLGYVPSEQTDYDDRD